jgi:hypothetical protein
VLKKSSPIQLSTKLKPAGATVTTAILGDHGCKTSTIALVTVAPRGTGYELAVASQTGSAARLAHARRACGISLDKSLSRCICIRGSGVFADWLVTDGTTIGSRR